MTLKMILRLITFTGYLLALATLYYTSLILKIRKSFTIYKKIFKIGLTGSAHLIKLYLKFRADIPNYIILTLMNIVMVRTRHASNRGAQHVSRT